MSEPKWYNCAGGPSEVSERSVYQNVTRNELDTLRTENAAIRAKLEVAEKTMATMVCGTCKGEKQVPMDTPAQPRQNGFAKLPLIPCPVCQPKEGA